MGNACELSVILKLITRLVFYIDRATNGRNWETFSSSPRKLPQNVSRLDRLGGPKRQRLVLPAKQTRRIVSSNNQSNTTKVIAHFENGHYNPSEWSLLEGCLAN